MAALRKRDVNKGMSAWVVAKTQVFPETLRTAAYWQIQAYWRIPELAFYTELLCKWKWQGMKAFMAFQVPPLETDPEDVIWRDSVKWWWPTVLSSLRRIYDVNDQVSCCLCVCVCALTNGYGSFRVNFFLPLICLNIIILCLMLCLLRPLVSFILEHWTYNYSKWCFSITFL